MGLYKYLQKAWKDNQVDLKDRMVEWRKEPSTIKVDHPTRLDRARALGYKAKQGVFIVRQRVDRGGRRRPQIRKGRRTKARVYKQDLNVNYKWVAEQRATKMHINCEVLNSYFLAKDGTHYWYEVIMVDRASSSVKADEQLSFMTKTGVRGRTERGLTNAAKQSRGLFKSGKGSEKARPSAGAHGNRNK